MLFAKCRQRRGEYLRREPFHYCDANCTRQIVAGLTDSSDTVSGTCHRFRVIEEPPTGFREHETLLSALEEFVINATLKIGDSSQDSGMRYSQTPRRFQERVLANQLEEVLNVIPRKQFNLSIGTVGFPRDLYCRLGPRSHNARPASIIRL